MFYRTTSDICDILWQLWHIYATSRFYEFVVALHKNANLYSMQLLFDISFIFCGRRERERERWRGMYMRTLKNNQNWRREKHFYLDVRTICFSPNGDLALRRRNKRIIERLCWWTRWILKNEITSIWDDTSFLLIIGKKTLFSTTSVSSYPKSAVVEK